MGPGVARRRALESIRPHRATPRERGGWHARCCSSWQPRFLLRSIDPLAVRMIPFSNPVTVPSHPAQLLMAEPRQLFREIDGVKLHWIEYGEASDRPPVVLLHGLNDSHLTWRQIAPVLSRSRRVLVLDLPGHGLSGRPDASYELSWYAQTIARWI